MKKYRIPRKLKKQIPQGQYCYKLTGKTSQVWNEEFKSFVTAYKTKFCPFYFYNHLGNGDCKYMYKIDGIVNGQGDDIDLCLDDQCKICNINYGKYK